MIWRVSGARLVRRRNPCSEKRVSAMNAGMLVAKRIKTSHGLKRSISAANEIKVIMFWTIWNVSLISSTGL